MLNVIGLKLSETHTSMKKSQRWRSDVQFHFPVVSKHCGPSSTLRDYCTSWWQTRTELEYQLPSSILYTWETSTNIPQYFYRTYSLASYMLVQLSSLHLLLPATRYHIVKGRTVVRYVLATPVRMYACRQVCMTS